MAVDLAALLEPGACALITQECQKGVIGQHAALPALAEAATQVGLVDNVARLAAAARGVHVPVVHCVAMRRADGLGSNTNARLFHGVRKSPVQLTPGTEAVEVLDEIGVGEHDLVLSRLHGLGPLGGTDLDPVLRNLGVRTIVGVGVSLNVGMLSFLLDAVNLGYQFVLPRDAVVGVPVAYGEAVLANTCGLLATVVDTAEVLEHWG